MLRRLFLALFLLSSTLHAQQPESRPIVFKNGQITFAHGKVVEKDGYTVYKDKDGNLIRVQTNKIDVAETKRFIDILEGKDSLDPEHKSLAEQIELYKKQKASGGQPPQLEYRKTGDPRSDTGADPEAISETLGASPAENHAEQEKARASFSGGTGNLSGRPTAIPEETWNDLRHKSELIKQRFDGKLIWTLFIWLGIGALCYLATIGVQLYLIIDAFRYNGLGWGLTLVISCLALLTINFWPISPVAIAFGSIGFWFVKAILFMTYIAVSPFESRFGKVLLYWAPVIYALLSLVPAFFMLRGA